MSFCTACGAALAEGATFCTSCGRPVAGGAATAAPYAMAPPPGMGPAPGRIQDAGSVLLLSAVTLTVYFYIWLWRVTGEVDAYAKRPGWSRNLAMAGIVLAIAGVAAGIVAGIFYGLAAFAAIAAGGTPPTAPVWLRGTGLLGAAAAVVVTLALRHVWTTLAEDARAHGRKPVDVNMLTIMSLVSPAGSLVGLGRGMTPGGFDPLGSLSGLLGLVGLVLYFVVLHRTQTELNAAWTAAAARAAPLAQAGGQA